MNAERCPGRTTVLPCDLGIVDFALFRCQNYLYFSFTHSTLVLWAEQSLSPIIIACNRLLHSCHAYNKLLAPSDEHAIELSLGE